MELPRKLLSKPFDRADGSPCTSSLTYFFTVQAVKIRWKKNEQHITPTATASSPPQILPNGHLLLNSVSESDGGVYTCVVSVVKKRARKKKFLQTVVRIQKEIISGDASSAGGGVGRTVGARTVRVQEGADLKLQCEVLPGKACKLELRRFLKLRNCELRFFMPDPEIRNCESEYDSFSNSFSIQIPVQIPDKLLKTAKES